MRKGNGVYKDSRTGRFVARLVDAYGRRRSRVFDKQRDAEIWLSKERLRRKEVTDAAADGLPPPVEQPKRELTVFAAYVDGWYKGAKQDLAHSTRVRYEQNIALIKQGPLGRIAVDALTYRDVEAWLEELADATVAGDGGRKEPRFGYYAVRQIMDLLRRITARMKVEHGLTAWACESVRIPKRVRRRRGEKREALAPQELGAFLAALDAPYFRKRNWRALFWTLAATGMRPCEALALRRRDVDLVGGQLHVRASAYMGVLKESTKTDRGRTPAIPAPLEAVLRDQLARIPRKPDALVFATEDGGPHWESTLKKPFAKALTEAGIIRPGLTVYSLRNTANSIAHELGADGIILRDILGHSSPAMTALYKRTRHEERAAVQEQMLSVAIRCHSEAAN